jgi:hypothetical protein
MVSLPMERTRTEKIIKLDSTQPPLQHQEIKEMVRLFHSVSKDLSMKTQRLKKKLKVHALTLSVILRLVMKFKLLDQLERLYSFQRIKKLTSSCSPLELVSLHSDLSSGDSSWNNTQTTNMYFKVNK